MGKVSWTLACLGAVAVVAAMNLSVRADSVSVEATFVGSQTPGNPTDMATTLLTSNYNDSISGVAGNPGPPSAQVDVYASVYQFSTVHLNVTTGSGSLSPAAVVEVAPYLQNGFLAVCIDFTHNVTFNQTETWDVENLNATTPMDPSVNGVGINPNQAKAIEYLWDNYSIGLSNSALKGAFQMAVWDVIYDGHLYDSTFSGGKPAPYVTYGDVSPGSMGATANSWASIAEGAAPGYTANDAAFVLINTDDTQSFNFAIVGASPNAGALPVPVPASAGVGFGMLAGFGGVFGVRKRMKRKPRIV